MDIQIFLTAVDLKCIRSLQCLEVLRITRVGKMKGGLKYLNKDECGERLLPLNVTLTAKKYCTKYASNPYS